MPGGYLKTNYRKTGGVLDITAIGGGFPKSPGGGGAGTPLAYGGFIYVLSYSVSLGGSTKTFSNALADSAKGILSWYFTSYAPATSGYKFLPLGWIFKSISDSKLVNLGAFYGATATFGQALNNPPLMSMSLTDSIFGLWFGKLSGIPNTGSVATMASYSGEEALLNIWGFIVSGP